LNNSDLLTSLLAYATPMAALLCTSSASPKAAPKNAAPPSTPCG